jgi:excisionase family DNA binding protein
MIDIPDRPCFKVSEVAEIFNVSQQTIRNWIECEKLKAVKLPTGILRIPKEAIIEMQEKRKGD